MHSLVKQVSPKCARREIEEISTYLGACMPVKVAAVTQEVRHLDFRAPTPCLRKAGDGVGDRFVSLSMLILNAVIIFSFALLAVSLCLSGQHCFNY